MLEMVGSEVEELCTRAPRFLSKKPQTACVPSCMVLALHVARTFRES